MHLRKPVEKAAQAPVDDVQQEEDNSLSGKLDELHQKLVNLKDRDNALLYCSGLELFLAIRKLSVSKISDRTESELKDVVELTSILIKAPKTEKEREDYTRKMEDYHKKVNSLRHVRWGQILGGMMLALLGTALVLASGIVAAVSFGLLAPFALFGVTVGASTVIGACAAGAAVVGSIMTGLSFTMFGNAAKTSPFRNAAHTFENVAKETLKLSAAAAGG